MKKVAILQSNYIPWKGYFDMIAAVDEFIFYDDVQFTKNDWRNRNKIKTPQGVQWLTIPVGQDISRRIRDVKILGDQWRKKHWKTLEANYGRSPFFDEISSFIKFFYFDKSYDYLCELNYDLIKAICSYLNIDTKISFSYDYDLVDGKSERLVDLCSQVGATDYISGPAAKSYLSEDLFKQNGIAVHWFDYNGYREYPQLWGEFCHEVSILDLLFNCGDQSLHYMRYTRL